jgi:hypothetical protein
LSFYSRVISSFKVFSWERNQEISTHVSNCEFLGPSNDSQKITIRDMSTYLLVSFPTKNFKRGDNPGIKGQLFTGENTPLANSEIKIFYDNDLIVTTTTSDFGSFDSTFTIPNSSAVGQIPVKAQFPGTNYYAEAILEDTLNVEANTDISIISPVKNNFLQNESVRVKGGIVDDDNNPVQNAMINLTFLNISRNLTSDSNGSFETTFQIPENLSNGTYIIQITFDGINFYLPSDESILLKIGIVESNQQGLWDNNLFIVLIFVILGIIIGVIVLLFFKRKKIYTIDINPDHIKEISTVTINKLKNNPDYKKTVLECYNNMCKWLEASGVKKNKYDTPREFAITLKKILKISDASLISLVKIFEKAFYSEHEIVEEDKKTAINCLKEIISSLVNMKKNDTEG